MRAERSEPAKRRASEASLSEAPQAPSAKDEKLDLGNFHGGVIASAFLYDEVAGVRAQS